MGRLDEIIERNKHPRRHRKMKFPVGLMLSAFVLLVIVLMIFTDLGVSPTPPAAPRDDESRVRGIQLRSVPSRDAGQDAP